MRVQRELSPMAKRIEEVVEQIRTCSFVEMEQQNET